MMILTHPTHSSLSHMSVLDLTCISHISHISYIYKVTSESWVFMKEISSDGDVSTIDVIYPASPFFLATSSPETLRRMMLPLLVYANDGTKVYGDDVPYTLQWAPHHLGVWPICTLDQDDQEQMPMEESGNLLLMIAGIAYKQGWNSDSVSYLNDYWTVLNGYADYLVSTLPDPGDQLCTDDFEGPSPHNANLAAKGVVALAAWAELLLLRPDGAGIDDSTRYAEAATVYAGNWTILAMEPTQDRYKMEYDLNSTFSLKYNLLFQYILDLPNKPFDDAVIQLEETYYTSQMNEYGIPLDNRATFTKLDWSMWVGAMGTEDQFNAITDATFKFANECTDRVPLSDWTDTVTATVIGFQARPVMGGIYAKLLM
jgi:hypothetical protein